MKLVAVHSDPETFAILHEGLGSQFELVDAPVTEDNPEAAMVPCSLILLDFTVPDPVETLHLIRTIESEALVLLLLPTKYQFKVVSNLFHYGIKECILRPFTGEDINTAVRKALGLPVGEDLSKPKAASLEAEPATKSSPDAKKSSSGKDPRTQELAEYLLEKSNLPALPVTAMRVMRLCRNEDVTAEQLDKLIRGDQTLAEQLLRTANSALYRRINPVESVEEAIIRVGLKHVSNLAIGLSAKGLHKMPTPRSNALWRQSRGIACAAQVVARRYRLQEDAYVAGLLHNVGMTLLNNLDTKRYAACLELQAGGQKTVQAELDLFGVSHTQIGSALAEKWDIDSHFKEALAAYPTASKAKGMSKQGNILASSIKLGKIIMESPLLEDREEEIDDKYREVEETKLFTHPVVQHLGFSGSDVGKILDKLEDLFDKDEEE